jgi:NADH:ubiquinone oxidoreductase subunit B-like Fe-S oxidoreductase
VKRQVGVTCSVHRVSRFVSMLLAYFCFGCCSVVLTEAYTPSIYRFN